MPRVISTRPDNIRIDTKRLTANAITGSPLSDGDLEVAVLTALETLEVRQGEWDLYVHIYRRAPIWLAIHMYRHGTVVPDNWWEESEEHG